jgi:uncharacterized membrane protein YkoI
MNSSRFIPLGVAALALALASPFATARPHKEDRQGGDDNQREERVERPRARISLDQAVAMAERRFNARVVRTDVRESDDRIIYVLRLLNDSGRVWTVKVDATTGSMQ